MTGDAAAVLTGFCEQPIAMVDVRGERILECAEQL